MYFFTHLFNLYYYQVVYTNTCDFDETNIYLDYDSAQRVHLGIYHVDRSILKPNRQYRRNQLLHSTNYYTRRASLCNYYTRAQYRSGLLHSSRLSVYKIYQYHFNILDTSHITRETTHKRNYYTRTRTSV